jgi:glucosamine-6-phosphate deaminase
MEIRVVPAADIDAVGAATVRDALADAGRDAATLMPALGSSALGIYRALGRLGKRGELDTGRLRLVQLDEYLGVAADDPRSLIGWLRRDVAAPLGVPDARIIRLVGDTGDDAAACRAYDAAVADAGGIDVAILGLGPNGHLGFNEPPSAADAPTRRVALTIESLASNARYWPGAEVPTEALTAGMSTVLAARRIVLVVTGARKQAILERMLSGPVGDHLPASFLRGVEAATLLADDDAWPASLARPPLGATPP